MSCAYERYTGCWDLDRAGHGLSAPRAARPRGMAPGLAPDVPWGRPGPGGLSTRTGLRRPVRAPGANARRARLRPASRSSLSADGLPRRQPRPPLRDRARAPGVTRVPGSARANVSRLRNSQVSVSRVLFGDTCRAAPCSPGQTWGAAREDVRSSGSPRQRDGDTDPPPLPAGDTGSASGQQRQGADRSSVCRTWLRGPPGASWTAGG